MADDWDEEKLVSELREVFAAQQEVPPKVVEAGKRIFDWHYVDKELAQLSYDSTRESDLQLATRAEGAAVHALTFRSRRSRCSSTTAGKAAWPPTRSAASRFAPPRRERSGCAARPPRASTSSPHGSPVRPGAHADVHRAVSALLRPRNGMYVTRNMDRWLIPGIASSAAPCSRRAASTPGSALLAAGPHGTARMCAIRRPR